VNANLLRGGGWFEAARTFALVTGGSTSEKLKIPDVGVLLRRSFALGLAQETSGMDVLRERLGEAI
jgi:hypothetical protein